MSLIQDIIDVNVKFTSPHADIHHACETSSTDNHDFLRKCDAKEILLGKFPHFSSDVSGVRRKKVSKTQRGYSKIPRKNSRVIERCLRALSGSFNLSYREPQDHVATPALYRVPPSFIAHQHVQITPAIKPLQVRCAKKQSAHLSDSSVVSTRTTARWRIQKANDQVVTRRLSGTKCPFHGTQIHVNFGQRLRNFLHKSCVVNLCTQESELESAAQRKDLLAFSRFQVQHLRERRRSEALSPNLHTKQAQLVSTSTGMRFQYNFLHALSPLVPTPHVAPPLRAGPRVAGVRTISASQGPRGDVFITATLCARLERAAT